MDVTDRYRLPADLPVQIPVFPLDGVLLLPRGHLPLNIFEPRYLEMIDHAMSADRVIGMVQIFDDGKMSDNSSEPVLRTVGCCGRITSYAEVPDNRLVITLTGICRFRTTTELEVSTPYRQIEASYEAFAGDLVPGSGQDLVDRNVLLKTFKAYLDANSMDADWDEISSASNETLVNALSMLSPYPPEEKQALLEAADLKSRAEVLVALTEMNLARQSTGDDHVLQ